MSIPLNPFWVFCISVFFSYQLLTWLDNLSKTAKTSTSHLSVELPNYVENRRCIALISFFRHPSSYQPLEWSVFIVPEGRDSDQAACGAQLLRAGSIMAQSVGHVDQGVVYAGRPSRRSGEYFMKNSVSFPISIERV